MHSLYRLSRHAPWAAATAALVALVPFAAGAEEAMGKLVWIDKQHSALLLECAEGGCPTIPNAKTGETYTFLIPEEMVEATDALEEGQELTLVYEETADNAYKLVSVK